MILRDRWDGREAPFEGDRELVLRHLPADARILAARATVTPAVAGGSVETLRFPNDSRNSAGGATKTVSAGAVEVDLHARRTLVGVEGTGLGSVKLWIDLGGSFVGVGSNGEFFPPGTPPPNLTNVGLLPGIAASRFRLTATGNPDVSAVRVRSVPANISLALRGQPTFWFVPGELTTARTSPDFTAVLQGALPEAEVKDGSFVLPFAFHADGIARLVVEIEIEYVGSASVLPAGLTEATLPYDFGSLPTGASALSVSLPAGAAVVRDASLGKALGGFANTRVAFGPTGEVSAPDPVDLPSAASLAQPLRLDPGVDAVGVDLLLTASRAARLQVDLREDLDGKPGERSLWPAPVLFTFDPGEAAGRATWTSAPLPSPVRIPEKTALWLVLQSLDGDVVWNAAPAAPSAPGAPAGPGLQQSLDGGFSWRRPPGALLTALLRLREQPADFRMPVELQLGTGGNALRARLRRFDPVRRIDFPFAVPEIEDAFGKFLDAAGPGGCPRGQHLANGNFLDWIHEGDEIGEASELSFVPSVAVTVSPDGSRAYFVTKPVSDTNRIQLLLAVDLTCDRPLSEGLTMAGEFRGLAVHPAGNRAYVLMMEGLHVVDLATPLRLLGPRLTMPSDPQCLAVSPDGSRFFVGIDGDGSGKISIFDTARIEEAAGGTGSTTLTSIDVSLGSLLPTDLAVTRDGSLLWTLATDGSVTELLPVDLSGQRVLFEKSVKLTTAATHLALSPDGATAVLGADDMVIVVRLAAGKIQEIPLTGAGAVAVAPDGRRAFVVANETLRVVELDGPFLSSISRTLTSNPDLSDVAVTPQGDRILVTDDEEDELYLLPVGILRPAVWTRVSGLVAPACAGQPGRRVAFLGQAARPAPATNTVLSQVVAISPGCPYELAFDGAAGVEGAVAEVLWRGQDCAAAGSAAVPIAVDANLNPPPGTKPQEPVLRSHLLRLAPPAGAAQAEVRFRVPQGAAAVTAVSLRANDAVLAGLRPGTAGTPDPWLQIPAGTPGFSRAVTGDTVRLRNAGAQATALAQTVNAPAEKPFHLEVRARSTVADPRSVPAFELRWLKADGTASAPATVLEARPESFDGLAASGTVPEGTAKAELRIVIPPGATLDVERLDLRFPVHVDVPVTFIAETTGELTLLGWRVSYEERETPPPAPSATGLCPPTTRGGGHGSGEDCGCGPEETAPAAVAPNRSRSLGNLVGGPGVAVPVQVHPVNLDPNPVEPAPAAVLTVVPGGSRSMAELVGETGASVPAPVTRIRGIGRGRTRALKAAGMASLEAVATSDPATLRHVLRGVTEEAARRFIRDARDLLRQP